MIPVTTSRLGLQARRLVLNRAISSSQDQGMARMMSTYTPPPSFEKEKEQQRKFHSTTATKADAAFVSEAETSKSSSSLVDRFVTTAEVTVSKIFPAGFGWQTSSIIAENNFGFAADTLNFALTTGVGDGVGKSARAALFR